MALSCKKGKRKKSSMPMMMANDLASADELKQMQGGPKELGGTQQELTKEPNHQ